MKGQRPISFKLGGAWRVENEKLKSAFAAGRDRLAKLGRSDAELRVRRGFHG